MPLQINAVMRFERYSILDDQVDLYFLCRSPGPGEPNEYRVSITDAEMTAIGNLQEFRNLVDAKLKRQFRGQNVSYKLDQFIGEALRI